MSATSKVIGTAGIISVGVGTANSYIKNDRPPSFRFLIGSGVAYLGLSALSEVEPEVAKGLAIAIATTVLLGDGGGVLSYIATHGETDTQKPKSPKKKTTKKPVTRVRRLDGNGWYSVDDLAAFPGLTPTPPFVGLEDFPSLTPLDGHLSPSWGGANP
jgi:hypothetical protein